jgi:outer membrane beta-barrel protein
LYDKFEDEETEQVQKKKARAKKTEDDAEKKASDDPTRLSELTKLSPFENVAVIQRRFLPKTGRFEFSANGSMTTNNAFFNIFGIGLRAGFHFNDKHSIEGSYTFMTSSERPITTGLVDNQQIQTASLVEPESFMGAHYKWSPIYGKVAWFQQKIIPYDLYFSPGFGVTQTVVGGAEPTMSLAMGQLFALSKSSGVRWDLIWNTYQAEVEVDGDKQTNNHNDVILSLGWSFFFPEATYR